MRTGFSGWLAVQAMACCLAMGADWPQLQRDAARTGRTTDSVAPPYRARWIWLGPSQTLRNRDSVPGWPDDLRSREGYTYPGLPTRTDFTVADSVQPVVAAGRLFFGTMEGRAFALDKNDGSTAWEQTLPAGTVTAAAAATDVVVWGTVTGEVVGLRATDGSRVWQVDLGRSITSAPCLVDDLVIVATHGGRVVALEVADGAVRWRSTRLPAPIYGGLASDGARVYVGAENMVVYALGLADGTVVASRQVRGQSFRMLWPVVHGGRVWVNTVMTPITGSEYVGESNSGSTLFQDGATLEEEEANLLRWLAGDTNGGRWPEVSADWRRLFALDTTDLSEPFVIPAAPADGVGVPAHPVVIDSAGRVLAYFKTRFPTLTAANGAVFGTQYTIDIAGIHPETGRRVTIDNGRLANLWPWETDNLYGLAVAGTQLWMRQNFRGTQVLDLATSTSRGVSAPIRHYDGGRFQWDVVYRDQGPPIRAAQSPWMGRTAPVIAGDRVYQAESWAITCIEHAP